MLRVVVTDANIFFDLMLCDLLDHFCSLPIRITTTAEVLREFEDEDHHAIQPYLAIQKISIVSFDIDPSQFGFSTRLSQADISVLVASYQHNYIALTGERKMSKWCEDHQIECHGIIWVFDYLISTSIIDPHTAADLMEDLTSVNDWLPKKLCHQRIIEWRKTI